MRWMPPLALLLLAGCSSLPVSGGGIFGGLVEEQITNGTFRIVVPAAAPSDATPAQDRLLLKAAETARSAGGTHFQVLRTGEAQSGGLVAPVSAGGGGQPQIAYVKVITVEPGQQPPSGALSIDEVLQLTGRPAPAPAAPPAKSGASG